MNPSFTSNHREIAPWLQTVLNDSQDAVIITNRNFDILHRNTAAEILCEQRSYQPPQKNFIGLLDQLFPGQRTICQKLQQAIKKDEPDENIFLATPEGKSYRLSCYTHKFPGTDFLLDVVIIIRDLEAAIRRKNDGALDELLYKSVLDILDEGVILVQGEQGCIISANKKAIDIIGGTREMVIGSKLADLRDKAVDEKGHILSTHQLPAIHTMLTGEPLKQVIAGYQMVPGKTIWLSISTKLIQPHSAGAPGLVAVAFFDVTRRIEAESRAMESETIFSAFMNNTHSPAWIVDEDGILIYMNDVFRQIWKLSDSDLYTNLYDILPREMVNEYISNNQKVLNSGMPLITIENSLRSDGSPGVYLVHKFLVQTSHPKRLIGGQSIDISDEKRAQEEIAKGNERFFYATKATSDSIWDWNIRTGHIYRSESFTRLTGYGDSDIETNLYWWYERIHPDDRERVMQQINSCLVSNNNYYHDEYRFRCADGSYKHLSDNGYIIYRKGEAVRAIGAIQDLTEQRKLETALARQKEEERLQVNQAMIAGQDHERNEISKELHDNVNQILSSVNILLTAAMGNPEEQDHFMQKAGEYLNLAIQEIRKISKSLNSSVIEEVGLQEPVKDVIENMKLACKLEVEFDYDPAVENGISEELKLALYRIIQEQTNNIIRYAEASHVLISIRKTPDFLSLTIQDNGKGFDLNKPAKGIGLINIRNRVETFGGSLSITTRPQGGCRLAAMIPLSAT